ncbi:hypothetical protein FRC10_009098 [Ceratobasidium sp. 414]|nr:hypothetical protein FRC10_009098 [Ceratobasidium sp. 414]
MVDYQCPTCFEAMDEPKYAPVALKCDVYRVYLPTPVRSLSSTSSSSSVSSGSSGPRLSKAQLEQAHAIAEAASRLGVESTEPELKKIVTSAEQWYVGVDQRSEHSREALDTLLTAITELRRKLVYAVRLDSAKDLQRETRMQVDMYRNEIASYEQRFHQAELEIAQAQREVSQWEKVAKRAETKAAQWEQQANVLEERRYTESIRAEGAVSILRSQIGVLQKEVQEQTQRKLRYKKKYHATKQSTPKNKRRSRCCTHSDDDSLEILSSTSTADEAEISTAFSVPSTSQPRPSKLPSASHAQTSTPPRDPDSDDDSRTVIYGPPSQPRLRVSPQKKRKLSDASTSTTTSTASPPPPLDAEEQSAREAALDNRFSKRLRMVRQEGIKEGWVPPDWKARVVMADRIKEAKASHERVVGEDTEKPQKGASTSSGTGSSRAPASSSRGNARASRT